VDNFIKLTLYHDQDSHVLINKTLVASIEAIAEGHTVVVLGREVIINVTETPSQILELIDA
jgi:hypothetical protein